MTIPALDQQGLLPVGTHDCSLDEIELSFCWNIQRRKLFDRLRDFLTQIWAPLGIQAPLWVDGSFTRRKEVPEDIDVVADVSHLDTQAVAPVIYLFFERERLKNEYQVDFWVKHPLLPNDLTQFFCYAGTKAAAELGIDSKQIKGILRINP